MKQLLVAASGFALVAFAAACTPAGDDAVTPPTATQDVVTPGAVPPPEDPPADQAQLPPDDACNPGQYANLVGRPVDMPGVPPASPDVRHIHPDTQVTMDYRPDRLNIDIDADGVITGFRCG